MKYLLLLAIVTYLTTKIQAREFRDYDSAFYEKDVNIKPDYDLKDAPSLFEKFIKDYDKTYKDEEDKRKHYEIFKKNLEEINKLNKGKEGETATFDINMFTDVETTQEGEEAEDNGWGPEPELTSDSETAEWAGKNQWSW